MKLYRCPDVKWHCTDIGQACWVLQCYLPAIKATQRGGSFVKTILWILACFVLQACTVRDFPPGFIITRGGGHVHVLLVSQPRAWHPSEFVPTERFVYEFRQIFKLGKHKRDMSTIADVLSATV